MKLYKKLVILVLLGSTVSCAQRDNRRIANESGGYSITLKRDWVLYKLEGPSTSIVSKKSPTIEATFYITVIDSEYESLEESFNSYVAQLPPGFDNYASLGNGKTQIDNKPAMWHKMTDTDKGVQSTTTLYLIQPNGNKLYIISCSAPSKSLSKYEEDFTEMTFSLSLADK